MNLKIIKPTIKKILIIIPAIVICLIVYLFIATIITSEEINPNEHITLKKHLEENIRNYKTISIYSPQSNENKYSNFARHIDFEISNILHGLDLKKINSREKSELIIEYSFQYGNGLLVLGRSFAISNSRSIKWLNLKIINQKTGEVLGEAEYNGTRMGDMPRDTIGIMLDKIIENESYGCSQFSGRFYKSSLEYVKLEDVSRESKKCIKFGCRIDILECSENDTAIKSDFMPSGFSDTCTFDCVK